MDKKQITNIIADNVRKLMNEEGASITGLARRCKVSTGTISKVINANMSITIPMAMTIASGLNVGLAEIMNGLVTPNSSHEKPAIKPKNPNKKLFIGIVSINNIRITSIQNTSKDTIGTSELEGGLDLAESTSSLMQLIEESINAALPKHKPENEYELKYANLNLVTQSYEFEETRHKFINFAKKQFNDVRILSDWQLTYLSIFDKTPGISLIVDKGISISYMGDGTLKKLGGWKFPVYDLGGENWLGVETIRHTIEAAEGHSPMTKLAQDVLAKFGGKIEKITETCFKNTKDTDIFCLFADPLFHAYFRKDPAAEEIINRGFEFVARAINRVDNITKKQLKIAISGSLTDIYTPLIKKTRLIKSLNNADKAALLAGITTEMLEDKGIYIN